MDFKRFVIVSGAAARARRRGLVANADVARAATESKAVTVSYESVTLNRAGGPRSLHERLESAARRACGPRLGICACARNGESATTKR